MALEHGIYLTTSKKEDICPTESISVGPHGGLGGRHCLCRALTCESRQVSGQPAPLLGLWLKPAWLRPQPPTPTPHPISRADGPWMVAGPALRQSGGSG